jgi:hypothetical protein
VLPVPPDTVKESGAGSEFSSQTVCGVAASTVIVGSAKTLTRAVFEVISEQLPPANVTTTK